MKVVEKTKIKELERKLRIYLLMIRWAAPTSERLEKKCKSMEAKKKLASWRRKRSSSRNWDRSKSSTSQRVLRSSRLDWSFTLFNWYTACSVWFILDVVSETAKMVSFVTCTILRSFSHSSLLVPTIPTLKRRSLITQLVQSTLSSLFAFIMLVFIDIWMNSLKQSRWSTSVLFTQVSI